MVVSSQTRNVYDLFASVYARHFGAETLRIVLPIYERLALVSLPSRAHVLDLCCGSGQLAAALIARGLLVTGIDNSEAMLQEARANAPEAELILADVRDFSPHQTFAAVLSTFNSMAHIPDAHALTRVFSNVRESLTRGALFCFDLFLQEAYERRWHGEFRVAADGESCVVRPSYDASTRTARNEITLTDDATGCVSAAFTLFQKAHTEDELRSALASAGFTEVDFFDAARDFGLDDEAGRAFLVCRSA